MCWKSEKAVPATSQENVTFIQGSDTRNPRNKTDAFPRSLSATLTSDAALHPRTPKSSTSCSVVFVYFDPVIGGLCYVDNMNRELEMM